MALGWSAFARLMEQRGAATVAEVDRQAVAEYAEKLWVVPPGGSLL